MTTEPFDVPGQAGAVLEGRLDLPDGEARAYALFAHCFTCTKQSIAAVRIGQALVKAGIGVLRFDFTGLGEEGSEDFADTFTGNVADVAAAADAMTKAGRAPTLLIGHSLGGAAVLAAALALPRVAAVVTIGAPFDVAHIKGLFADQLETIAQDGAADVALGGRRVRISREFIDDLSGQDQGARIAALKRPLLILHSPRDEVVGVENASEIFEAALHPKSFVSLDEADHLLTAPGAADYAGSLAAAWAAPYLGRQNPASPR